MSFPEQYDTGHKHFVLSMEHANFTDPRLEDTLEQLRATTFETLAPQWRHIRPDERFDRHGEPIDLVDFTHVYEVRFDGTIELEEILDRLAHQEGIVTVRCGRTAFLQLTPDDPYFDDQWHLANTGQVVYDDTCDTVFNVNAPGAWEYWDSAGTKIAIMDDGIKDVDDLAASIDFSLSRSWVTDAAGDTIDWRTGGGMVRRRQG